MGRKEKRKDLGCGVNAKSVAKYNLDGREPRKKRHKSSGNNNGGDVAAAAPPVQIDNDLSSEDHGVDFNDIEIERAESPAAEEDHDPVVISFSTSENGVQNAINALELNLDRRKIPFDADDFILGCEAFTKQSLCELLVSFERSTLHEEKARIEFRKLLFGILSRCRTTELLPLRLLPSGHVQSRMEDYCQFTSDHQYLRFDCCPCDGTVYHTQRWDALQCGKCKAYRYHPCSRCGELEFCSHMEKRTPMKSVHYRPIKLIIKQLLQFDSFRQCLNYVHMTDNASSGIYSDVTNGRGILRHKKYHFDRNSGRHTEEADEETVFILLSLSYDGAQIHRSKASPFYPIMIQILNLPPSFRKKFGLGMFFLSVLTSHEGISL